MSIHLLTVEGTHRLRRHIKDESSCDVKRLLLFVEGANEPLSCKRPDLGGLLLEVLPGVTGGSSACPFDKFPVDNLLTHLITEVRT